MTLKFITGNKNKFLEAKKIFDSNLEQEDIDVDEIQSLDEKEVIEKKLKAIKLKLNKPFFCEDVSLQISALNNFPGPFIKYYLKSLGKQKIYDVVSRLNNQKAKLITFIGYYDGCKEHYFKGEIKGEIVKPLGESGFGVDPIFKPEGYTKTFALMHVEDKNKISHRFIALKKLKDHLKNEKRL